MILRKEMLRNSDYSAWAGHEVDQWPCLTALMGKGECRERTIREHRGGRSAPLSKNFRRDPIGRNAGSAPVTPVLRATQASPPAGAVRWTLAAEMPHHAV